MENNKSDFVHLHVHTEYSLLDGADRITDLLDRCAELNMDSIAITDHGVMYGAVDFYKEAKKRNIKAIIGCEVYIAPRSLSDKDMAADKNYSHLILLSENQTGYKNLIKLVSIAFTEGYYYKPRIDYNVLEKYHDGLICLSACLAGDIPKYIMNGQYDDARDLAVRLSKMFGKDHFYIELQDHGLREQQQLNPKLVELSRETGIPLAATNDVHYVSKEDSEAHDVLLCIQTGKTIDDDDRLRFQTSEYYLKSPEEMQEIFAFCPEAIENTRKIADMCNFDFDFSHVYLPSFDVPEGTTPFDYLKDLCEKGLHQKYSTVTDVVRKRLDYELSVIRKMGYVDYFLIVWDFVKYAKDSGIMVGPGRGSGAGSIVAYVLNITTIDPIKYNLLFERFLNPERVSMPDIDCDFCYERRQDVISYVVKKYGKDRVAQIITFGTMAARAAIRDVGRALNMTYHDVDVIAKMIPTEKGMTIDKALSVNPELKKSYEENSMVKKLIDTAKKLEGLPRHSSTHAAGVVICRNPVTEYVPLQKNDDNITTQYTMGILEELGLLKMDFLGLRTLTVIQDTVNIIYRNHYRRIDMSNIDYNDKKVYKMISTGDTKGVFQLESTGMAQFMKELRPDDLEDIIAGISLYRPGPMEQIPRYIEGKKDPSKVVYAHPLAEPALKITYGCMVYQEQVMQLCRDLAGYSLGRADLVRGAMAKKKMDVMKKERPIFIYGMKDNEGNVTVPGAISNGVSEDTANSIFDEMTEFAKYAFNKSHATAYSFVAYQTAWLKYYYPVEFMAALLTSLMDNTDKIAAYIQYSRKAGIEILPPDVNRSYKKFTVENNSIRFGLAAIKNVGINAIDSIIEEREKNGAFKDFLDFCDRIDQNCINKRMIESLIKSGSFDSMHVYRSQLLAVYEKLIDNIEQQRKKNIDGQISLFEENDDTDSNDDLLKYPDIDEYSKKVLLTMEKEMTGIYISGHPLAEYSKDLESMTLSTADLKSSLDDESEGMPLNHDILDGKDITIGGIITKKKIKSTKSNSIMAFITIDDLYGSIEALVFPSAYQKYEKLIDEDNIIGIRGKVSIREDEDPKILCNEIWKLIPDSAHKKLYLKVSKDKDIGIINILKPILKNHSGNLPVYVYDERHKKRYIMDRNLWISDSRQLVKELTAILGDDCVKFTL